MPVSVSWECFVLVVNVAWMAGVAVGLFVPQLVGWMRKIKEEE